jgi:hypothetical protein
MMATYEKGNGDADKIGIATWETHPGDSLTI